MLGWMSWLSLIASGILIIRLLQCRRFMVGLTVMYSWGWALSASIAVLVSALLSGNLIFTSPGWKSASQVAAVVLLLTPAVSTLGARKPGVIAWQFFVVLPLILVLFWPAASQLISNHGRAALDLGVPAITGVVLVLMMSAGTCLGTGMTIPAILYLAAVIICLLPASGWTDSDWWIPLGTPLLLLLAEEIARRALTKNDLRSLSNHSISDQVDESWNMFQNLYGLVWARRVQDRVNLFASREQWVVNLTLDGFRDALGNPAPDQDLEKPREAFRWVLSRFADEEWLKARLYRLR